MSATKRSLDEIRGDAMDAMDANDNNALGKALHDLGQREAELVSEKIGVHLDPQSERAQAELWLEERHAWDDQDDPRWRWLSNFMHLLAITEQSIVEPTGDEERFVQMVAATMRLLPALPEAFDLLGNRQVAEACETITLELDTLAACLPPTAEKPDETSK